jgi:murein L,D-transpeptidase YafK
MTDERLAQVKSNYWYGYLKTLKQGFDYFEKFGGPPKVAVCERRYVVNAIARGPVDPTGPCPAFAHETLTAFTPMPEQATVEVANGNKMKGITNPDVEPTLNDINTAKQMKGAELSPAMPGSLNAMPMAFSSTAEN